MTRRRRSSRPGDDHPFECGDRRANAQQGVCNDGDQDVGTHLPAEFLRDIGGLPCASDQNSQCGDRQEQGGKTPDTGSGRCDQRDSGYLPAHNRNDVWKTESKAVIGKDGSGEKVQVQA